MIAELYGKVTGCARAKERPAFNYLDCGFFGSAPILASTISVGVGVAWASKRRKRINSRSFILATALQKRERFTKQ